MLTAEGSNAYCDRQSSGIPASTKTPVDFRQASFPEVFLFLLGAAGAYSVNIVGALPDSELLLIPVLPILLLLRGRRAFHRQYLWFASSREHGCSGRASLTPITAWKLSIESRGSLGSCFFILDFIALAIFLNNRTRKMVIFAMGIGMNIGSWNYRGNFNVQWKFGMAQSVAIVALLVSSYFYAKRRYGVCLSISLVLAGLSLTFGFRSQLAVLLLQQYSFCRSLSRLSLGGLGARGPKRCQNSNNVGARRRSRLRRKFGHSLCG